MSKHPYAMLLPVFTAAIEEDLAWLIVALDELDDNDLELALTAAQMVDSEAQELWEQRHASNPAKRLGE